MTGKTIARDTLFDLLTSIVTTVLVLAAALGTKILYDMRGTLLLMAFIFLAAGITRGKSLPARAWLKALLLVSVCLITLRVASGMSSPELTFASIVSYFAAFAGVCGRRSWATKRTRSMMVMSLTLAAILIVSLMGAPPLASHLVTHAANRPAYEFSVTQLNGVVIDSSTFKHHVVVLDFWATWCPPCRQEFPELEKLYARYRTNPNVIFLAIDVNREGETPEKARAFLQKAGYTIPTAFDNKDTVSRLKAEGYPHLLLLDKAGQIRLDHIGYDGAEPFVQHMSAEINKLLAEPGP